MTLKEEIQAVLGDMLGEQARAEAVRTEQARWERFFVAALQGTAAAWTGEALITNQNQIVEAVSTASCLADEAMRVADDRAELRRKETR